MAGVPDLSPVVNYFSAPVQRRRAGGAATVNAEGLKVAASTSTATIRAHCFPTPGHKIERLPEGHSPGASIEIHTSAEIFVAVPGGARGDVITWNGDEYEVDAAGDRTVGPSNARRWGVFFGRLIKRGGTL